MPSLWEPRTYCSYFPDSGITTAVGATLWPYHYAQIGITNILAQERWLSHSPTLQLLYQYQWVEDSFSSFLSCSAGGLLSYTPIPTLFSDAESLYLKLKGEVFIIEEVLRIINSYHVCFSMLQSFAFVRKGSISIQNCCSLEYGNVTWQGALLVDFLYESQTKKPFKEKESTTNPHLSIRSGGKISWERTSGCIMSVSAWRNFLPCSRSKNLWDIAVSFSLPWSM